MPTVKIKAISKQKLPSPLMTRKWIEAWSAAVGGAWAGPNYDDNECTVTFDTIGIAVASPVVQATIESYNETHLGNDTISVSIH